MVLPTFVQHAVSGLPLPILNRGEDIRCFQHVSDAVRGIIRLASEDCEDGLLANIGSDRAITVRDLALIVGEVLGRDIALREVCDVERYGSPSTRCLRRVPDLTIARDLLGHEAQCSLEVLIRDLAEHCACVESSELRA